MFDTGAFDSDVETVAHFILVIGVEFAAEKRGDVIGLDGMNRRAGEIGVNGPKIGLSVEHHIGGVFALVQTPVIHEIEVFDDGAILTGKPIQYFVGCGGPPGGRRSLVPDSSRRCGRRHCPASDRECAGVSTGGPASYDR